MTLVHRHVELENPLIDLEKGSLKILWSTGAPVLRRSWASEAVYEVLDMSENAIDLSCFRSGKAPLLLDHESSVKNIVGVIESASLENGEAYSQTRFGSDEDSQKILRKINDGLISNVSVGYQILKTELIRSTNKNDYDTVKVTKWRPQEISLVVFPADPKTGLRNLETETFSLQESLMTEAQVETPKEDLSLEKIREFREKEKSRITEIQKAVRLAHLEEDFALRLIDQNIELPEARSLIFSEMERQNALLRKPEKIQQLSVPGTPLHYEKRSELIADALLHRLDPSLPLSQEALPFSKMSMLDAARFITQADSSLTRMELVERALSTSDFPLLLQNVLHKNLRREYEEAPRTYEALVRKTEVVDFKPVTRIQFGDALVLEEKPEHSEYKEGSFSEAAESYALKEYGKMVSISRIMLINDDLGALLRITQMFARRASELESDLAWGCLIKNPLMGDGIALFDKKHANLASTASPLSVESLSEARRSMRAQRGLTGARLNILPKYLIVPASLEGQALQFLQATTPARDSDTNPYKSMLSLIVEPRLDDISPTGWYLSSDSAQVDLIEMAYLQGQGGLYMESKVDFGTDGIKIKCRMDVGAKTIDWRGFYYNPGK